MNLQTAFLACISTSGDKNVPETYLPNSKPNETLCNLAKRSLVVTGPVEAPGIAEMTPPGEHVDTILDSSKMDDSSTYENVADLTLPLDLGQEKVLE